MTGKFSNFDIVYRPTAGSNLVPVPGICQVIENKDRVLQENVLPNLYWNRFDLRFGDNYDLYEIKSGFRSYFVAVHSDGSGIVLSMYLRNISPSIFAELLKFLFEKYREARSIRMLNSYTYSPWLKPEEHGHIELPSTRGEFDANLSPRVRYNTKWYPKKIRKQFGDYKIEHWAIGDTPLEIHDRYKEFKFATHGDIDNVAMQMADKVWAMYIGSDVAAILQISDTSGGRDAFLVNITYNQKYAKWSVANVLYYTVLQNLIGCGYRRLFLLGMLDYKRYMNGISTMTFSGTIDRRYLPPPKYLVWLAKFPRSTHRLIKFLLPHRRQKLAFAGLYNLTHSWQWPHLTGEAQNSGGSSRHSLLPDIFLNKITPYIQNKENMVFADIGCGTGHIISKLYSLFRYLIGIEYDLPIAEVCRNNLRTEGIANAEIYVMDTDQISDGLVDSINIFCLYSQFYGGTFDWFIENLNRSIIRHPRECILIYANPALRESADKLRGFKLSAKISTGGTFDILLYSNSI
ncbi:MAG: class I SAM-dependent methyltransferase [Rickettsiales bacterium]|nr:class I SAM-dependent methyltransferase [Rickettsiales bacterium]